MEAVVIRSTCVQQGGEGVTQHAGRGGCNPHVMQREGGARSFAACLSHSTIDRTSSSRWSTVPNERLHGDGTET